MWPPCTNSFGRSIALSRVIILIRFLRPNNQKAKTREMSAMIDTSHPDHLSPLAARLPLLYPQALVYTFSPSPNSGRCGFCLEVTSHRCWRIPWLVKINGCRSQNWRPLSLVPPTTLFFISLVLIAESHVKDFFDILITYKTRLAGRVIVLAYPKKNHYHLFVHLILMSCGLYYIFVRIIIFQYLLKALRVKLTKMVATQEENQKNF